MSAVDHGRLSREQEALIRLSRLEDLADNDARVEDLLSSPLDWNYLVVCAARHKVLQLVWHNLLRKGWFDRAVARAGLPELWTRYIADLYVTNRERNRSYLANLDRLGESLRADGITLVALKGAALIGDLYGLETRFLNDIDFLGRRRDIPRIKAHFFEQGYQYGRYDYASASIQPLDARLQRAWVFQNHTLPTFYAPGDDPFCPYYKVQVGFNFFDPFEDFRIDGEQVLRRAAPKSPGSPVLVTALMDTLINICCHTYREGVSIVYDDYNINWQLSKFCDVLGFIHRHGADLLDADFIAHVDEEGIRQPLYYTLYHTYQVYRDPVLLPWLERMEPASREFLDELRDGNRRVKVEGPFLERFFSLRGVRVEPAGGWSRQFDKSQW